MDKLTKLIKNTIYVQFSKSYGTQECVYHVSGNFLQTSKLKYCIIKEQFMFIIIIYINYYDACTNEMKKTSVCLTVVFISIQFQAVLKLTSYSEVRK